MDTGICVMPLRGGWQLHNGVRSWRGWKRVGKAAGRVVVMDAVGVASVQGGVSVIVIRRI